MFGDTGFVSRLRAAARWDACHNILGRKNNLGVIVTLPAAYRGLTLTRSVFTTPCERRVILVIIVIVCMLQFSCIEGTLEKVIVWCM